jgi:hypothetical protein
MGSTRTGKKAGVSKASVEVKVDRALKRAWESARHTLMTAKHEGAGAFDTLWETIGLIITHEPPLYLAGGYATTKAFLADFVEENERTAQRMIRVAKYASPNEEEKFGVSKLDAAIAFIEAKAGAPAKGRVPVDFAALRIPVVREGEALRVPLTEAAVEEVRRATSALNRAGIGKRKTPPSPIVSAITRALSGRRFAGVRVSVAHGQVQLGGIAVENFAEVIRALARVKFPRP